MKSEYLGRQTYDVSWYRLEELSDLVVRGVLREELVAVALQHHHLQLLQVSRSDPVTDVGSRHC